MAPDVLPWASTDWADAIPGLNIIQNADARLRSIGRILHRHTSFAVRLNQTAIRDVAICSLPAIYTLDVAAGKRRHSLKTQPKPKTSPKHNRFQSNTLSILKLLLAHEMHVFIVALAAVALA
jgi:hypothetical protein